VTEEGLILRFELSGAEAAEVRRAIALGRGETSADLSKTSWALGYELARQDMYRLAEYRGGKHRNTIDARLEDDDYAFLKRLAELVMTTSGFRRHAPFRVLFEIWYGKMITSYLPALYLGAFMSPRVDSGALDEDDAIDLIVNRENRSLLD
jgi:hypothetical protein